MKFLKVFLSRFISHKLYSAERGQASVLYALLTPIFLLSIGVTLDLGWYYLNVSRLQNAADSAAVAGAQAIIESKNKNFSDYRYFTLVKGYPGDDYYAYNAPNNSAEEVIYNSNSAAADYASKNLSRQKSWASIGGKYIMTDAWNGSSVSGVTMNPSIYKKDDDIYYVVSLKEKIRHFFLPGWFDAMNAPVTAVAMITKNKVAGDEATFDENLTDMPQAVHTKPTPITPSRVADLFDEATKIITEEFEEVLDTLKNENVIVGNWEVQNYYRQITSSSNDKDSNNKTLTRAQAYLARYGYQVYNGSWNHFQDFYNHYTLGDLYRKQTVTILDDVVFQDNQNGIDYKYYDVNNRDKNKGDIISYGTNSSVAATSASINTDKNSSAYNPQHTSTLKTHKSGITEKADVGLPYTAERLDSINIDFRPEVTLSGKWLSQDWDLTLNDFNDVTTFNGHKKWDGSGSDANKIGDSKIRRMRIHTSINFDGVYKAREEQDLPDILWARIESEPMLSYPDEVNGYKTSNRGRVTGLNSVNQIIINANVSNKNEETRPVIIFYDGPESYGTKDASGNYIRESLPVILNLKESFRGVLYAPNSPVVVIGKNKMNFQGFVVAKKYMALKDDSYFYDSGEVRYFNNASRQYEYTRETKTDGGVQYRDLGGKKISDSVKNDSQAYRLKVYRSIDPNDEKNYYKVVGKTDSDTSTANTYEVIDGMKYIKVIEENGIDMYVDDYGEIQFVELSAPPTGCGTYDNFEKTDFTTHNYHLLSSSSSNMLLSGN